MKIIKNNNVALINIISTLKNINRFSCGNCEKYEAYNYYACRYYDKWSMSNEYAEEILQEILEELGVDLNE